MNYFLKFGAKINPKIYNNLMKFTYKFFEKKQYNNV